MKVKIKKLVEAPSNVKETVKRISSTPIQDLGTVLRGFVWTYEKGDINHWVPVLDHFDAFLEKYVSTRADVQLKLGEEGEVEDPPFPTDDVLAVLRATCSILENCSNKGAYNSSEHLSSLLAAPVLEVSAAALQVLQVLLRKTHHTSVRLAVFPGLTQRLLSLCKGWGGKEEGLDLVVCASADESAVSKVQHKATVLNFEFTPDKETAEGSAVEVPVQPLALSVPGVDKLTEPEHIILAELVKRYKVPTEARFELLCRIRIARNFGTLAGRRQLIHQRLLAFNVLLQCSPSAEEYNSLYVAEPELVSELVGLVQAEGAVDQEELRTLALRALAAQLQDRSRSSSVMAAVTSGGQSGLLAMLMHKSVASILQQANVPLAPSGSGVLPAAVVAAAQAGGASSSGAVATGVEAAAAAAPAMGSVQYSVAFVDALLALVAALVTSSSGCQALNDAGVISALLPLLRDDHPDHLTLVCTSLKILEMYMDLSQTAATSFRDLGGLSGVIKRLAREVDAVAGTPSMAAPEAAAAAAATTMGDTDVEMAAMEQPAGQTSTSSTDQVALGAPAATKQLPHNRKSLLKILLRIITISSYQPTGNLSATRPVDDDAQLLYASLKAMYSRAEEFGGTLFSHAVSVMTDLIHHEPQSFRQLQEAGLPDAFLDAVKGGVFPSGDAICAFPGALVALCLNSTGLRRVREAAALNVLVDIFVSKKSMRMLTGDTPSVLGSGLEELMRFVPSLRSDGVDVVLGVFKALCILGGDEGERSEASAALLAEAPQQLSAAAVETAQAANPGAEAGANAGTPGSSTAPLAAVQPMETDTAAAPSAAVEQLGAGAAGEGAGAGAGPAGGTEAPADEMDVDVRQEQAATAEQSAAVPQVEPTPAPAAPAAAAQATPPEHEQSRQLQQAEDARLSATARRVLAQSLHQVAARHDLEEDIEAFLPLALTAASRMLEPLLANAETSRLFVERGGADLLLKLYKLPRLTTVFNFSSASHSLLSVFRALSGAHGSAIAAKSKEAVAQQLAQLLPMAEAVGPVCVPILPADTRDKYVKQVLVVQGLVALTSAVARNVTAMLPQVSMGDPPLLANMGKLERIVMAQAAASDPWKQARDAAKRAAAAVEASGVATGVDVHAQVNMDAGPGADAAAGAMDLAAAAAGDNDVMEGPSAEQEPDRVLPEGGGSAPGLVASNGKQKRTPEDTSYDALSYLLTSLRTFYMGTAKAIHTPVRRREEAAAAPTAPMKAAALNLALLLVGNLSLRPWCQQQQRSKALDAAALQASSPEGGSNTGDSIQQELNAAVAAVRSRSGHFLRVVDEMSQVLFDSRRHYCHLLVLNYFSALGGMQVYSSVVSDAAVLMWELLDLQQKAGQQAASGDQAVADTQQGSVTSAGAAPSASLEAQVTAAAAGVASSTAGTKDPKQIMEAVLVKMLMIYEQLANATVLLSAPQATHMLLAALPNYAGQPLVPPAKDALQFIQQLHGHIMCAVLPLWSNPKIADAPPGVLGAVIRVLQTCCQGPGHASLLLRYTQRPAAARIQTQPDPQMVQQITEMGFSQPRAEEALRRVGANSVELAMEWLITHPEERAAPAGGQATAATATGAAALHAAVTEEEELTRALLASLSVVGMSPDAVAQRSHQEPASQADASEAVVQAAATSDQQQVAETPETTPRSFALPNAPVLGGVAAAAAVVGTAVSGPTTPGAAASAADGIGIPAPSQLVDGALRLISASPATTFPISDLVLTIAQREDGKGREALLERLINDCLPPAADMASTSTAQQTAPGANALTPARLLLLLLHKDPASRRLAATKGIVDRCLQVLEAWQSQNAAAIERYEGLDVEKQRDEQEVKHLEVPVWVEAVFLLLDLTVTTQPKSATAPAARATREAARAAAITVASGTLTSAVDAAASAAGGLEQPSDQQAAASDIQIMAQQPAPARTGADAALPQQAAAPSPMSGDVPLPPELAQLPGLKQLLANWRSCGMLDEHQQERATAISLTMLQRLHKYANKWDNPCSSMFEAEGSLPNPGSATSVVLQLLSHLTRRHNNAQRVLAAGGHKLLLSLPSACLAPSASRQEGHIGAIFRHLLEDPITLEAWMESEIKNSMSVKGVRDPYPYARSFNQANPLSRYTTAASFLTMMSSLVSRDPAVFLQAVARTCTLETTRGETMVRLKTPREQQIIAPAAVGRDHANALAAVLPKPVAVAAAAPELGVTAGTPPPAAPSSAGGSADATGPAAAAVLTCDTAAAKSVEHNPSKPASRSSRKLVPGNFVEVVDALLDVVLSYKGTKAVQAAQPQQQQQHNTPEAAAMEVDAGPVNADGRASVADPLAARPAVAGSQGTAPLPADLLLRKLSPVMHEVGIQVIVLRLLADYCLLYNNTVGLLLKRDSDCGPADGRSALLLHHHHHYHPAGGAAQHTPGQEGSEGSKTVFKSKTARHTSVSSSGGSGGGTGRSGTPGTAAAGQAGQDHRAGSVLKHIMNVQLVDLPPEGIQAGAGVAANASALLQAVCIRSGEGRKRVLAEMVRVLTSGADQLDKETGSSIPAGKLTPSLPYLCQPGGPEPVKVAAYLGLLGALVQSSSSPGMPRSDPRQPGSSTSMPFELLRAMREAGVVKAVAGVLKLVDTNHAKAKDAISAILKPLEVLTRPMPKQLAATDGAAQQELRGILEQAARQPASDATAVASARAQPQQTMHAAATGSTNTGPAAAGGSPAAGQPQAGSGDAGVGRSSGELFSSGVRAAVDEDQRQQAGEAAAGPTALAAAGRFVAGGAGQVAQPLSGGLIDHLMEQLVDIEVELGAGEDDDGDGSSDDEGSSDGDSRSDEGDEGSDEDMAEREEHEDGIEGHAATGGSDEGVMGDAPSLTEGGEESDEQEAHGQLILGDAGVNAGLSAAATRDPEAAEMADINSSEEEPESDDDPDHTLQHHHHHFQDALLPEDEMHLLPPQLQGAHHAQDGVVDPLDDEEEEEEEDEYLDDDDERSDDEEGRFDIDITTDEFINGEARFSWEMPIMPGEADNVPPALMMPGTFGRAAARRMLYRPAAATTAAGVWDDSEPGDAAQDPLNGVATMQMLLSQFGINANGASSVAMIGPNGRQYRMALLSPDGTDLAGSGRASSGAMAGAMNGALYSISMQLMPQQHRLLALPPRVPVSDSAALLESAGGAVPTGSPATAAAADADVGMRGNAASANALTRLLARTPEGAGVTSYLRDGARARLATQRQGGLFSVALDPAGVPATLGPAANLLQSVNLLQPGALLSGAPGAGTLADVDNSVWDEAVNQLLEALAPQGLGRARTAAAASGSARAGAAAEDAAIDPRSLESQMLALLRAQAPRQPLNNEQQQQEIRAAPEERHEQAVAPHTQAAAGMAAPDSSPDAADAPTDAQVPAASEPHAGRRATTQQVIAAAIRAAMQDEPATRVDEGAFAQHQQHQLPAAAGLPQQQPRAQQQQQEQAAAISSHPVEVGSSAPDSPAAGAASVGPDQSAPMDIGEAAAQVPATPAAAVPTHCGTAAAAAVQGEAAAAGGAAAMEIEGANPAEQEALRQAAEAAEVDLTFLEALPEELRVEVLSARGVELRLPQPQAALQPQATAAAVQVESPASATAHLAAEEEGHTPAAAVVAPAAEGNAPDMAGPPAASGTAEAAAEGAEASIDPEFLAALPEDIRQEVLAQQAAERRARAATRAAQQRQQEMGLADLLAAMDDDARADALGQLQDSDLAQLPPMMRAQAQALRERVARQQQALQQQQAAMAAHQQQQQHDFILRRAQLGSSSLGGIMGGAANRLLMPMGPDGLPLVVGASNRFGPLAAGLGSGVRTDAARAELLEAAGQVAEESEGPPLLDETELDVLVHLLQVSLPLSKVHLQKLLLNLAGHSITREQLLRKLLGLLRALPGSSLEDSAAAEEQEKGTGSRSSASMDTSDGTSGQPSQQHGLTATLDVLGAAVISPLDRGANAAAEGSSGLVVFGCQGKPAIISRRVLDMLAYLSRHSQLVARQMLQLRIPDLKPARQHDDKGKGKSAAAVAATAEAAAAPLAVEVLLAMLSAPLCQRSLSLLEQLSLLLEVVLSMVQRYEADMSALAAMREARKKQQDEEQSRIKAQEQQQQQASDSGQAQQQQAAAAIDRPGASSALHQNSEHVKAQGVQLQPQSELASALASIAPGLLQQLPGLLAREALSESAYVSIAKIIKLIVESAPVHLPLMLAMLVDGVSGVATRLLALLDTAAVNGIDADAQLAPAIGTKGGVVLRMLYALQGFQTEVRVLVKQQEQQHQPQQPQAAGEEMQATTAAGDTTPASSSAPTPAMVSGDDIRPAAASSNFAAGSSAAASMVTSLDPVAALSEVDKAVASVVNRTSPLWKALSSCILRVEDNLRAVLPHTHIAGESAGHAAARLLPPGAQQVLPLVEAFFVLCALQGAIPAAPSVGKDLLTAPSAEISMLGGPVAATATASGSGGSTGRAINPTPSAASQLKRGSSAALDAAHSVEGCLSFIKFAEWHRRLLNAYIRRNTSLLESSLAPLLGLPKLIDFDNKRAYFKSKVRAQEDRTYAGGLRLAVKRSTVFEDSFNKLRSRTPAEMRGKLSVSFIGEEGIDAGGVSREWYQVMAREIFNPNLALFVSVPEGGTTFQPNPNSVVQSDTGVSHLEFFKFVGRLVGKALYDGQLMDAHFTRSFYKHMLGQPLTYEDIEAVDPEYYKNLKWMLENDITDVLDLTFTAESDFFGKTEIGELIPGGREVKVTEANKHEYVNLIARHRMTTSIKAQIQGFLEGFWQLVPRDLICIFNDHELELLISGLPDIDVADLRANTEYTGYSAGSPVIQWFWQVVSEMDKQDLALLLQFVTGTSKVPLGGFKSLQGISGPQRFQIHKSYGANRLPSAHTCFNQLDLPEYESKEQLAERLAVAVHEGHEGFGFG